MSVCEWCDVPTVAETRLLQDRMDGHRAFHAFGRVVMAEIIAPVIRWIERRLTPA